MIRSKGSYLCKYYCGHNKQNLFMINGKIRSLNNFHLVSKVVKANNKKLLTSKSDFSVITFQQPSAEVKIYFIKSLKKTVFPWSFYAQKLMKGDNKY